MKNFRKIFIISVALTCFLTTLVFAKAGSYSSTYEMKGGVFSRWIQPKSKCTITVTPKVGTNGVDMKIIWAHQTLFGWDGPYKNTSSTKKGSVSFKSNKKRKVWLRNPTGKVWKGNVSFKWD